MGRFQKRSFFCENETIVFENDRLTNQKTIVKRSFSKTINNPKFMNYDNNTFLLLSEKRRKVMDWWIGHIYVQVLNSLIHVIYVCVLHFFVRPR